MATAPPVYSLGMDMYVPNDNVRAKPTWATLSRWVIGEAPEQGGIPTGIKGIKLDDALPAALLIGNKRAATAPSGVPIAVQYIDCTAIGRGGTKNTLATRNAREKRDLQWSMTLSSGHILALSAGRLIHFSKFGRFKFVDLTQIGYGPNATPAIQISTEVATHNDMAYLLARIGESDWFLYRYSNGKLTKVIFNPGPTELNFNGYIFYPYELYTGYNGDMVVRTYTPTNTIELIAAHNDIAQTMNYSANSLINGLRLFPPCPIDSNFSLCVRYGVDRMIPGSTSQSSRVHSILTAIEGNVSTDIASLSIQGQSFVEPPSIDPIGQGIAIVTMPKIWPVGVQPDVGYNVGFSFDNPYSYWGTDFDVGGFTMYEMYRDIFVASGRGVMPLLSGNDYNRDITVLPTGGGTALLFSVRRATPFAAIQPEIHFFDGSEVAKFDIQGIWPDITGLCIGDGVAVFSTGNLDTSDPSAWYLFRSDTLMITQLFVDPYSTAGMHLAAGQTTGYIPKSGGFFGRQYKDVEGMTLISILNLFYPDGHAESFELSADGLWQKPVSVTVLHKGAVIVTHDSDNDTPMKHHFFYLGIIKTTDSNRSKCTYMGSVNNTSGGYYVPKVIRVGKQKAVLQMDYAWDTLEARYMYTPLEMFMVSSGPEGGFVMSKKKHPKHWVGELKQIGEGFVLFPPSEIFDLRPSTLATRGEI